jgi:hypothetical protein
MGLDVDASWDGIDFDVASYCDDEEGFEDVNVNSKDLYKLPANLELAPSHQVSRTLLTDMCECHLAQRPPRQVLFAYVRNQYLENSLACVLWRRDVAWNFRRDTDDNIIGALPRLASFVMNAVGSDFKIQVGLACLPYPSCLNSKTACLFRQTSS